MIPESVEDDPVLLQTVEQLLQNSFRKGVDGMWNIYDEAKKVWRTQEEEPSGQIKKLKKMLL